jgi:hypothetical protein
MNTFLKTAAALLFGGAVLAPVTIQAHGCGLAALRLGLIDQPDCVLDAGELMRGIERHQTRQKGLYKYEYEAPPPPPPKPNLTAYRIDKATSGGNAFIDARVRVENSGTADTGGHFDVEVRMEFLKLDDGSITQSLPVTLRMQPLAAGARERTDWISGIGAIIPIPDPDPDYDVTITATVDLNDVISEGSEIDNVTHEICRIPGYGEGQNRPLLTGEDYCRP